ncbi:RusA family crossover junction endodeoxyribonuclease [Roseomonas sp. 18066]|uniref:RusA family crossover junction endodeoxyribonuclease n=1 Tax=Roseomonas sp. 18066 TaxID=2681412 RepID=UPI001357A0B5|nr:RusA family crossover junction endodeoxyribonuclease [Roseomonas sp. 18066]
MDNDGDGWLDQEREGARSGINPMFGEWRQHFDLDAVPYGDGGAKRAAFRHEVQSRLRNKFFFSGDVQVNITLYMDIRKIRETSSTADVDNYAKCLLDALKGPDGIILDDSQVQSLSIHWLQKLRHKNSSFEVEIKASPDSFCLKPISFYEMPNSLWYPFSEYLWTDGKPQPCSKRDLYTGLKIEASMTDAARKGRHLARQLRASDTEAYWKLLPLTSSDVRGFHRSRIDDGFSMFDLKTWRGMMAIWAAEHPEDAKLFEILDGMEDNHLVLAKLLGGWIPPNDASE